MCHMTVGSQATPGYREKSDMARTTADLLRLIWLFKQILASYKKKRKEKTSKQPLNQAYSISICRGKDSCFQTQLAAKQC
jgi:hypothetical protein